MPVYGPTNIFASQNGQVPVAQLDQDFTDAFAGINNAFLTGTLAARPAVDGVGKGRFYFANDDRGGTLYRDNGAAWVQVASQVGPQIPIVAAGGTADAITATYSPAITLSDLQLCAFTATAANATSTPTFAPNGLTAHTITKKGGSALVAGDIPAALAVCLLEYNLANTRWELLNPTGPTAGTLTAGTTATQNPHAVNTKTTQAHGLGATPSLIVTYIECLTAEQGYSIGDRLFPLVANAAANQYTVEYDSTNVNIITNSAALVAPNKTTPAGGQNLTSADWKVVAIPYKIN